MATKNEHITAEQLFWLQSKERCELVNGELRTLPFKGFAHGMVISNIAFRLTAHVCAQRCGVVVATGTGFVLRRNPDTVRGLDLAFVSAGHLPEGNVPEGYFEGAPDLAVEVVSPSDTVMETEEKIDEYVAAGARLVWLVSPKRRTVTVYREQSNPAILREADALDGEDVLPGFSCRVGEIFA